MAQQTIRAVVFDYGGVLTNPVREWIAADATVFGDDAEPNVIGAQAVGLQTVLHESAAQTRATLREWRPALPHGGV